MLLLTGLIVGLAVGALRGGDLFRLGTLRGLWFAIASLVLDPLLHALPDMALWPKGILTTACYFCILMFIYTNRQYTAAAVFLGGGTLCNYAVRAANAFRMPVSAKALEVYEGLTAQEVLTKRADYFIADEHARLLPLGDVLYLPVPGLGGFASVGDILLALGVCLLVIAAMGKNQRQNESTER
ncbi:MAG: DUF5317 family protein [Oscillospiraceae bacterium]|jgi:hypothetical protein